MNELASLAGFIFVPFVAAPLALLAGLVVALGRLSRRAGRALRWLATLLVGAVPAMMFAAFWRSDLPAVSFALWWPILWVIALVPLFAAVYVAGRVTAGKMGKRPAVITVVVVGLLASTPMFSRTWELLSQAVAVCGPVDGVQDYIANRSAYHEGMDWPCDARCTFDCAYPR